MSSELNPEFKKISDFFGNIYKEVKSLGSSSHVTDDIIANLNVPSAVAATPARLRHESEQSVEEVQQEEFELQLAMALSLSEEQATQNSKTGVTFVDQEVPPISPSTRLAMKFANKGKSTTKK